MNANSVVKKLTTGSKDDSKRADFKGVVDSHATKELIFAVVGFAGSGTSEIAKRLESQATQKGYEVTILKASKVIERWLEERKVKDLSGDSSYKRATELQDAGDQMREEAKDNSAVAARLIKSIREDRARNIGADVKVGEPVIPDGRKRAYILDSIRHPDEVQLLRKVYQDSFCLIGVVADEDVRQTRLKNKKFSDASNDDVGLFMKRDERADKKSGQRVADAFYLSDFFVENSQEQYSSETQPNPDWTVNEQLSRLIELLTREGFVRPTTEETGMFVAEGARMHSSCLSRQVGASILDYDGNVVSTGMNEVPKAGGGLYGEDSFDLFDSHLSCSDGRCFKRKYCSSTRKQNEIIEEILDLDIFKLTITKPEAVKALRKTRLGQLLEFSRSVHAEMAAIITAGQRGNSVKGCRLFVTTYPCHNCARHIIAAGIDEVVFIEPYLKSLAVELHEDSITQDPKQWQKPSEALASEREKNSQAKVLFRPFSGISPRLYRKVFLKDMELKDGDTGDILSEFQGGDGSSFTEALRVSYADIEAKISGKIDQVDQK